MIVHRGFKQPTSYHAERLRAERAGYFFDVITNGFGQMSGYAVQVTPEDRWAIVAWIRTLQAGVPSRSKARVRSAPGSLASSSVMRSGW